MSVEVAVWPRWVNDRGLERGLLSGSASMYARVNNTRYTYAVRQDGVGVIFLRSVDVEVLSPGELSTLIHGAVEATNPGAHIQVSPGLWNPTEEERRCTKKLAALFPLKERRIVSAPLASTPLASAPPASTPLALPCCCNLS